MLKLTNGTPYSMNDLAQVCRDDAALDRPIASPFGLRRFLHNAQQERITPLKTNTHATTSTDPIDAWVKRGD